MKQVFQNLKDGRTEVTEVPCPGAGRGKLLIRSSHTLVSAGTERMLVDLGKASLIDKARQQPDKVRVVLDKIRTDGLMPTLQAVRNMLGQPLPMGYCNVGVVPARHRAGHRAHNVALDNSSLRQVVPNGCCAKSCGLHRIGRVPGAGKCQPVQA